MTVTTIKVSTETRDALRELARETESTMDSALAAMLKRERRRRDLEAMRRAIEANPPDEAYFRELKDWVSDAWN